MSDSARRNGRRDGRRAAPGIVRRLLRIPLFYKILLANVLIVMLGAVAGTALTVEFLSGSREHTAAEVVIPLGLAGAVVTIVVNALILRVALEPLEALERAAAAVHAGDMAARAPLSPVADRELGHLIRTFNAMLDGLELTGRRLREVASRAIRAAEEERLRIARELHDETAQHLAALLLRLRLAAGTADAETRDAILAEVRGQIAESIEGIRRYARGLRPPALEDLGLVPAVAAYARMLGESSRLRIDVEGDPVNAALRPEAELALYRMIQEALSNVLRHARAEHARVAISLRDDQVVATVEDDGVGFDPEAALREDGGLGLFGMRERAAYVGGSVEFDTSHAHGTRVVIRVPTGYRPPAADRKLVPTRLLG